MSACSTATDTDIDRPRLEGSVAVRDGRRLSFAEFGRPRGDAIVWMHGTPGARRQVPIEARAFAEAHDLRIIGVDRPGIGSSTPYLYPDILDWTGDLELLADTLAIERMWLIGLSGGGPYALAAGAALPERVRGVGVLGGVAPTKGPDAIRGGLVELAPYAAPVLSLTRVPLGFVLAQAIRLVRPLAGGFLDAYGAVQPRGDKELLARPEFRAMFLDDLLNGSRFQVSAPLADIVLFTRPWGFEAAEVTVPVLWWHGDSDHIVPHAHGEHVAARLPDATFRTIAGESHLGGMGLAEEVLGTLTGADRADRADRQRARVSGRQRQATDIGG
ncbi:MAG: alpha/beta fold hydrolase [Marmoricola sp.]